MIFRGGKQRFFDLLLYKGGGSEVRDLAAAMLTFAFAHTFSYTPLNKGGYRKKSQQRQTLYNMFIMVNSHS
jgi:hypothetical protein